jgi:hypothetical protein
MSRAPNNMLAYGTGNLDVAANALLIYNSNQ